MGFPCISVGKESAYNAGDLGSIHGLQRAPGEGHGNPLQYSCLENPMACSLPGSSIHGVARVGHDLVTKLSAGRKNLSAFMEWGIFLKFFKRPE